MFEINLGHYLTLSAIIFTIGVAGIFLNRKNIIVILMSIELILLAVNINLVSFSVFLGDLTGQIFTLFILTVAAAEAAIGLAIIVVYFRNDLHDKPAVLPVVLLFSVYFRRKRTIFRSFSGDFWAIWNCFRTVLDRFHYVIIFCVFSASLTW